MTTLLHMLSAGYIIGPNLPKHLIICSFLQDTAPQIIRESAQTPGQEPCSCNNSHVLFKGDEEMTKHVHLLLTPNLNSSR